MNRPLPFAVSLPHCSTAIPRELSDRLAVGREEVARSADLCTGRIFGGLPVLFVAAAECSRLVVDLNRAADDQRPLGVIPQTDYWGNPVWKPGRVPSGALRRQQIERYYSPFHAELQRALDTVPCAGLIDCHSLEGVGPVNAPDPYQPRADVTLGNLGDAHLPTSSHRRTSCPAEVMEALAEAFRAQGFSVSLNSPYFGGFITGTYGPALRQQGKWAVQVELNEDLYKLPGDYSCDPGRLPSIQEDVGNVLGRFADHLERLDEQEAPCDG